MSASADLPVERGDPVAVAVAAGVGVGFAGDGWERHVATPDPGAVVAAIEHELRPRWVWWSNQTASALLDAGVRVGTCWDVTAVHRLLFGRWRVDPAVIWAELHDLPRSAMPRPITAGQLDLELDSPDSPDASRAQLRDPSLAQLHGHPDGGEDRPVRPDGHLRPAWVAGGWAASPERVAAWASTAWTAMRSLHEVIAAGAEPDVVDATARVESAAELLAAELQHDGLPIDVATAERLIADAIGPRPRSDADAAAARARRDEAVLRHAPAGIPIDLRNPAQVRSALAGLGIDVPDTRGWRLEAHRDRHPFVDALLAWRRAERIATTFGHGWLDRHVGGDGRLRGGWSGSDGAAGRMTAQAGLHNLPAELRAAVAAEPGHVLVRADLGQIEPRVLAAVSGDPAFVQATREDDMYAPVAARLGVERGVAKVAVLAAMYGQTSGAAGHALERMQREYPVALRYLRSAEEHGRAGIDVRTRGGRVVRMSHPGDPGVRGRYARNAVVQGAAAELFKVWAAVVRTRAAPLGARIVLCLHDELLVHAPEDDGAAVATAVRSALDEAADRWMRGTDVRFVVDVAVVRRWSEASG